MAIGAALLIAAPVARAEPIPEAAHAADVVFLGEVHDNPAHHAVQAAWVRALAPEALVFEMLTPEAAARATSDARSDPQRLEAALGWEASGWPDFDMYFPIFAASPDATINGAAIPRDAARTVMEGDLSSMFSPERIRQFGLAQPLPANEQAQREALQAAAHCDALPAALLPAMVNVQRARDAALAQAVLQAAESGLTPVVVITGNGHVRQDWGAPSVLKAAAPDLIVFALGQSEAGAAPQGGFDQVVVAPAVDRPDPCAVFR